MESPKTWRSVSNPHLCHDRCSRPRRCHRRGQGRCSPLPSRCYSWPPPTHRLRPIRRLHGPPSAVDVSRRIFCSRNGTALKSLPPSLPLRPPRTRNVVPHLRSKRCPPLQQIGLKNRPPPAQAPIRNSHPPHHPSLATTPDANVNEQTLPTTVGRNTGRGARHCPGSCSHHPRDGELRGLPCHRRRVLREERNEGPCLGGIFEG